MHRNTYIRRGLFSAVLLGGFLFFLGLNNTYGQTLSPEKRAELEQQLKQLEAEATVLDQNLQQVQGSARTLAGETARFNTEIKRKELEIRRINLVLQKTTGQIQTKSVGIAELSKKIQKSRNLLATGLLLMSTYDRENLFTILIKHNRLSEFFAALFRLNKVEENVSIALGEFKEDKTRLEEERVELTDFQKEQKDLKTLQEAERKTLAQKKKEKDELLRLTKGKEALFQQILKSKKRDIATLKTQLFYLEKTGITAEEAVRFADLAAKRTGIRTAFLLALLEVETGKQFEDGLISVGTNLGTGHWRRDLYECYIGLKKPKTAEAEKNAFFAVTGKLGMDPEKMPVSRKPSYGCGGAMGPAQFLPSTWLLFEKRVASLTGHNPANPWNPEDAFTAAAIYLADAGATAKTTVGETRAAKAYISGKPNCTQYVCISYANRILALSRDIDRTL
ncbi:MAG: lytic murein transglycosylase [Candidatus Sungbacteria bacterium]|nr:lytic murein transglycosylase [Candidatus Sungbacteria bacterium]